MSKPRLTVAKLQVEAGYFAAIQSSSQHPDLFGVTDGKAVGTYVEHRFREHLREGYEFQEGSSAKGIDFPGIDVDMKVTSIRQPQSSCPYRSARQKIFGLGYAILVFVYQKTDDHSTSDSRLDIQHVIFVEKDRTADFQTTTGIRRIIDNEGNKDDILAFIEERRLPVDEIEAERIAEDVLKGPPTIGYLTISNALQWRLQYRRIMEKAGIAEGVIRLK